MQGSIRTALEAESARRNCRILAAVESGSRAWGFASPDSDYDVRAIYVNPLDFYLGLGENRADTWNAMLPGDLDIAAWDLRKVLRQLMKSNASLLEWIGSPIVYSDDGLLSRLAEFGQRVFNPVHVAFHYASMFRHAMEDLLPDGTIGVKKLCYALRANACVKWIMEHETMPPTEFSNVISGISLDDRTRECIARLMRIKARSAEKDRVVPEAGLAILLKDRYDEIGCRSWNRKAIASQELSTEMERFFIATVKNDNGILCSSAF